MKTAIIVFPGSNCDKEMERFLYKSTGLKPTIIWHKETFLPKRDLYVLPGGFSYGDYLRGGALASHSPVVKEIIKVVDQGRKVLGICNGFQILCEVGLLPGTLLINRTEKFICKPVEIEAKGGESYIIPIAHKEGNFYHPVAKEVNVAYTYKEDVNGSVGNITGVYNNLQRHNHYEYNVLGMMPHLERAFESYHCSQDGRLILENLL